MSPIDYALTPIRKYADFSGRARRSEYWWYVLGVMIVSIVANIIDIMLGMNQMVAGIYGPFTTLLLLGTLIPSIAVAVRRLHDTDRTGWWLLIMLTGIGAIVLLIFYILDGTHGDNRFGPDPKAAERGGTVAAH